MTYIFFTGWFKCAMCLPPPINEHTLLSWSDPCYCSRQSRCVCIVPFKVEKQPRESLLLKSDPRQPPPPLPCLVSMKSRTNTNRQPRIGMNGGCACGHSSSFLAYDGGVPVPGGGDNHAPAAFHHTLALRHPRQRNPRHGKIVFHRLMSKATATNGGGGILITQRIITNVPCLYLYVKMFSRQDT